MPLTSTWQRLPVIVRAVLIGLALSAVGTIPWALLSGRNLTYLPSVPWAALVMAPYLWFFWRYLRGDGWPRSTAEARRTSLRANPLSDETWGMALLAGILGLGTLVLFLNLLGRMVRQPQQQLPDLSQVSFVTLASILAMGSLVAGVVEEASVRGYMQGPIERRHGPVVAILATGLIFGFLHFTHPEVTLALLPYYLMVSAIYGGLAWLTNSIWPGLVLHAVGNFFSGIGLLATGHDFRQATATPPPLIWETGPDATFWMLAAAVVVAGAITVGAYAALARVAGVAASRTA